MQSWSLFCWIVEGLEYTLNFWNQTDSLRLPNLAWYYQSYECFELALNCAQVWRNGFLTSLLDVITNTILNKTLKMF